MSKKTFMAATITSALLVLLVAGIWFVNLAGANPAPYSSFGTSLIEVSIQSPKNMTYSEDSVELTVNVGAFPGVWWVFYSLDNESLIQLTVPGEGLPHYFSKSIQLNGLSEGSHNIVAKAGAMAHEPVGTVTACSQVYFSISTSPTISPTPSPSVPEFQSFAVVSFLMVTIALSVIFYRRKLYKKWKQLDSVRFHQIILCQEIFTNTLLRGLNLWLIDCYEQKSIHGNNNHRGLLNFISSWTASC